MSEKIFPKYGKTVFVNENWITMDNWFEMTIPASGRPQIVYMMFTSPSLLNTDTLKPYYFIVKIAMYENVAIIQSIRKLGQNNYEDDYSQSAKKFFMNNPAVSDLKTKKVYFIGEVNEHRELLADVQALAEGRLKIAPLFKPKF
jgi:hypothetical protein